MSNIKELGDQWELEILEDIAKKRYSAALGLISCNPSGEYSAQLKRVVSLCDRMLATVTEAALNDDQIDAYLDPVLKASGSSLRNYSSTKIKDEMRMVMRAVIEDTKKGKL